MKLAGNLSKREHQIMDLVYARGTITATELEEALPGSPSNSAVRTHLRTLETKGFLTHTEAQGRFVYSAIRERESVARVELSRLLSTFFGGSITAVVSTLLDQERDRLSLEELTELQRLVDKAAEEGR